MPMSPSAFESQADVHPPRRSLLLVDDNEAFLAMARRILSTRYDVQTCRRPEEALARLESEHLDAVLADLYFNEIDTDLDGFAMIERLRALHPDVPVIVLSRTDDPRDTTRALDAGAFYFVSKQFERNELSALIDRAIRSRFLERQYERQLTRDAMIEGDLVHKCAALQEVLDRVAIFAPSPSPVLITGETGTGKDLVAKLVHEKSGRSGPFHVINVTALADTLFEAELFGHERGAFTDARESRPGLIELAHGGTLFIDEIGLLSPEKQGALLRVIEDGKVRRFRSDVERPVDVRFVFATNENLARRLETGEFRKDLWYRINKLHIELPPLRERGEDVLYIADSILDRLCARVRDRRPRRLTEAARRRLLEQTWAGNVRELEGVLERALLYDQDGQLDVDDLKVAGIHGLAGQSSAQIPTSDALQGDVRAPVANGGDPEDSAHVLGPLAIDDLIPYSKGHDEVIRRLRLRLVEHTLAVTGGTVSRAADICGISRQTFHQWMKELGIERNGEAASAEHEELPGDGQEETQEGDFA